MNISSVLDLFFSDSLNLRICRFFYRHRSGSFSARKIASLLSENHNTVLKHLKMLCKTNILDMQEIGRSYQYSLQKNKYSDFMLEIIHKENFLDRILESIKMHFYEPEIEAIILFGSFARSESDSESDMDICFVTSNKDLSQNSFSKTNKYFFDRMSSEYFVRIEPLVLNSNELRKKTSIAKSILREGVFVKGEAKSYA